MRGILQRRKAASHALPQIIFALSLSALIFDATARAQQATGNINVRVTTEAREELIDQAEVRLLSFAAVTPINRNYTDGGGRVTFYNVRRGSYYVEVDKPGYELARERVDLPPGGNESVFIRLRPSPDAKAKNEATGTISASSDAPAPAREEFEKGVSSLKTDAAKSVEHLRKAIALHDGYAEAYAMLGFAHMHRNEASDAKTALLKAIELSPRLVVAHTLLGKLYIEERKFEEAEKSLLQSVALNPQGWDTHFEMSRCYFNMGKLDKALRYAERAHGLPGAATSTHLLLVDIYMKRNEREHALRELREFMKADPQSPFIPRVRQMIDRLRAERERRQQ